MAASALRVADFRQSTIDLPRTVRRRGESSEPPPLRFFGGVPDPLDDSRWTIRYEFGGGSGAISCRLRADDEVELKVEGPLASIVN